MRSRSLLCILGLLSFTPILAASFLLAQGSSSGQLQVQAPLRRAEPPTLSATQHELLERGDELRAEKAYPDALDYYRAALTRGLDEAASIHNRMGITQMEMERWKDSINEFRLAIKADRTFADAHNNLGVDYYELKKYGKAIAEYETAIRLHGNSAAYYSNVGAAYFAKKDFEKAAESYSQALQLDPDIFEHNSRTGVSARLPSPDDRAHFDYVMAKLYAKAGISDRSLEHLRRAMEEGYKGINDVYKDAEFTGLRKDPRFAQLMAARPTALPE
jgi:tetratricopeptide (TPR) repeat protein